MKIRKIREGLPLLLLLAACHKPVGPFAVIETSMGDITVQLLPDKAPKTVEHFIGLATGKKQWRDPKTGEVHSNPFYDGLTVHRVVPGFLIQTGDPLGNGQGDVGSFVKDEIDPTLRYDRPGFVGMASFGPDTGSSQFFITLGPAPDLDGRHTLFGRVVAGLDVAEAISRVPRDEHESSNRPLKPVWVKRIRIIQRP